MYKRLYYDRWDEIVHLWDDKTGYEKIKYKPYAYAADPNGEFETIDGIKVTKISSWTDTAEKLGSVYEYDVPPEIRVLIDRYSDSDDISDYLMMYIDIEVRKNDGYSTVDEAKNEITAISYTTNKIDDYKILLLNENDSRRTYEKTITIPTETDEIITCDAIVEIFTDESSLLKYFLNDLRDIDPDIITGWNIDFYDMPYLYNRITKVLGKDYANLLSPIKIIKTDVYRKNTVVRIAGLHSLDYMVMYKNFNYIEEPSYALNAIAKKELGRGKVEYSGSLDDLYNLDLDKYIAYSVVDTELVKSLDKKLQFIDIAVGICHKGHVPYDDIKYTSKYLEGALLTYMRRVNKVCMNKSNAKETPAEGAFVKTPKPGVYRWVYDLDLTSLYPWNIISLNISPETKIGYVPNWKLEDYIKNIDRRWTVQFKKKSIKDDFINIENITEIPIFDTTLKLKEYLIENNYSISSAGIIYDLKKKGIIPEVLIKWFDERKEFKSLMIKYGKAGEEEKEKFYDKRQLVTKILLNSVFGVLLLPTFRFYDKQNGESVTLTGQSVIHWATEMADRYYNKKVEHLKGEYEIEFEDGSKKRFNWNETVNTKVGKKYVFLLTENDEII